jgi:hypothetical protein
VPIISELIHRHWTCTLNEGHHTRIRLFRRLEGTKRQSNDLWHVACVNSTAVDSKVGKTEYRIQCAGRGAADRSMELSYKGRCRGFTGGSTTTRELSNLEEEDNLN